MLLTSLKIEHYRGIKILELALGPTTVLVGENNCGKTTVLHALRACLSALRSSGRASPRSSTCTSIAGLQTHLPGSFLRWACWTQGAKLERTELTEQGSFRERATEGRPARCLR
ncbi:AAA family ATPase [Burkholderia vietnamiensis]|uniref:AAA family ATPase n=1 Tax=Burkholderia vietnamiensis TaxID=60552 RepID=UPI003C7AE210